jgi:hypothetical protein
MSCISGGPDFTDIVVRAQPRSGRSEIAGLMGDVLKVRLRAPPVDGAANEELVMLLARALGVPRSRVELLRGAAGRTKLLRAHGLSPQQTCERLGL